jgi:hypothetical protein
MIAPIGGCAYQKPNARTQTADRLSFYNALRSVEPYCAKPILDLPQGITQ